MLVSLGFIPFPTRYSIALITRYLNISFFSLLCQQTISNHCSQGSLGTATTPQPLLPASSPALPSGFSFSSSSVPAVEGRTGEHRGQGALLSVLRAEHSTALTGKASGILVSPWKAVIELAQSTQSLIFRAHLHALMTSIKHPHAKWNFTEAVSQMDLSKFHWRWIKVHLWPFSNAPRQNCSEAEQYRYEKVLKWRKK